MQRTDRGLDPLIGREDPMTTAFFGRRSLLGALAASAAFGGLAVPASAQGVVNVYSNREPGLYSATLDEFTKATGIKVNAIFSEQGLAERIKAEGENSPADVLITVDIGRLQEAVDLGIAQPVRSEVLAANIPAQYRDPEGRWFGLSLRARTVYASKDRVKQDSITYEELADPEMEGQDLHAVLSAPVQHRPDGRDDREERRSQDRAMAQGPQGATSPSGPPAATGRSRRTSRRAPATSASATSTTSG